MHRKDSACTLLFSSLLARLGFCFVLAGCASFLQAADGVTVAVIDIDFVLAHHKQLQCELAKLDLNDGPKRIHRGEQRRKVAQMEQKLQHFKETSSEYRQHYLAVEALKAEMRLDAKLDKKEMERRHEALRLGAYHQVQRLVEKIAEEHNIAVVLRMDTQDKPTVEKIQGNVVYQRHLDITKIVLTQLNAEHEESRKAAPELKDATNVEGDAGGDEDDIRNFSFFLSSGR